MAILDRVLDFTRSITVRPTKTEGRPGTRIYGGYIEEPDVEASLRGREKYRTYSRILANTSVVSAGVRFFLNLAGSVEWKLDQAPADKDGKFKKIAEKMLFEDSKTPWHRVVRRAAMYRFYGFSVQEWTARRADDGMLTVKDVAPRPQVTIERWDRDHSSGDIQGIVQRDPQTADEIYLPRGKVVYVVDDTINDSPEGLGLFRHIVKAAERLEEYERLEGQGYVNDLRGVPVGRGPFEELQKAVEDGRMSEKDRDDAIATLTKFTKSHARSGKTSINLDSAVYATTDDKQTPSAAKKWDIEIIKSLNASPMQEVANAIQRVNLEIARVLGVEGMLLGGSKQGSFALSRDKSQNFYLVIEGTLKDVREALQADLLDVFWELNGLPPEMKPKLSHAKVQYQDAQDVAETLAAMARAGAPLDDSDPAIREVRHLLGIPDPVASAISSEADAELRTLVDNPEDAPDASQEE